VVVSGQNLFYLANLVIAEYNEAVQYLAYGGYFARR